MVILVQPLARWKVGVGEVGQKIQEFLDKYLITAVLVKSSIHPSIHSSNKYLLRATMSWC